MKAFPELLKIVSSEAIPILDPAIRSTAYTRLDLSVDNPDLIAMDITDPEVCQQYIDSVLKKNGAIVAYGGYLEKRNLYNDKANFSGTKTRNIHLGADFWASAGTQVIVPLTGKVHSFRNNAVIGDYGPTIILEHQLCGQGFFSLYGHLSLKSLKDLQVGTVFKAGAVLATLGTPDINVNYAPHLHFQLILDLQGKSGDYPGVCNEEEIGFYQKNCPDPNLLLGF